MLEDYKKIIWAVCYLPLSPLVCPPNKVCSPIIQSRRIMYFKKEPDGSMTLKIDRPEDMSVERFLVIAARLEKIIDKLGGKVRVIG